jgi:hypothetical protein
VVVVGSGPAVGVAGADVVGAGVGVVGAGVVGAGVVGAGVVGAGVVGAGVVGAGVVGAGVVGVGLGPVVVGIGIGLVVVGRAVSTAGGAIVDARGPRARTGREGASSAPGSAVVGVGTGGAVVAGDVGNRSGSTGGGSIGAGRLRVAASEFRTGVARSAEPPLAWIPRARPIPAAERITAVSAR